MQRKTLIRSILALAVIAALGGAYVAGQRQAAAPVPGAPAVSTGAVVANRPLAAAMDFSTIVERFGPAVVNVSMTGKARPASNQEEGSNDPFFEFFRRFGPQFQRPPQGSQVIRGQGSGFIVESDGLILTNAHVIEGATEVTVKLTDRREFTAKVLGADKQTDVAVLRIEAKGLPVVQIGDPALVRVGEPVLAIGAPFGFENSASAGIVSAKSRSLPDDNYVPFIQTDVAVNPGNSGGPLFNSRGEVIGINSQIYSQTGGYQGLSFAIPMNVASRVQAQLVKHGKVTRGRLGISIQDVNQALADSFGLKKPQGGLVSGVEPGGPAEKAGLLPGDVIVKLGDRVIERSSDLPALVAEIAPGTKTTLEVIRKGHSQQLSITVGEMQSENTAGNDRVAAPQGRLGLSVRPLSADEQQEVGIKGGLLVEESGGPAARAGVQPGDVVLALNGSPVKSVDDLKKLLKDSGKRVALLVWRDGARIFIPVDLN